MPELRKDPLSETWVVISPERKRRPQFFKSAGEDVLSTEDCPFCPGNEDMTPPEIYSLRDGGSPANKPGWKLRVIPNKYPAFRVEGQLDRFAEGFYDKMNGIGAHEVVIETHSHSKGIDELSVEAAADIFITIKRRILDLKQDMRLQYIQVFKNHGSMAGATISHPHSQIIALPLVPQRIKERLSHAENHFKVKNRCLFCDIIHHEREFRKRIVMENNDFIVLSPFAPRFPFELAVYPVHHKSSFHEMDDNAFYSMALIFKDMMARLNKVLEKPAYNLALFNTPFGVDCRDYFHWHFEFIPVISGTGGFELSTQSYINPIPPEEVIEIFSRS